MASRLPGWGAASLRGAGTALPPGEGPGLPVRGSRLPPEGLPVTQSRVSGEREPPRVSSGSTGSGLREQGLGIIPWPQARGKPLRSSS